MKTSTLQVDLRVALLYALFGGLWILLSDRLLAAFITDVSLLTTMQTYKGWAYVVISALLIYSLLRRESALRKIAEDKLRESEERYRLLFETSIDAFLLTAPDGSIHAANPAACRMFGWTEEEIKKIGRSGVVDKADPRLSAALEERASKGNFRGELTFVRKDGTKFSGEISTAIFTDKQGNAKTSMVIRDITERVQAEEKLRESQLRLAVIIDSAMDAIVTLDADQNIILFNPAAEKMFLCSADEAIGQPLARFIPERSRAIHRENVRSFGQTNQTKRSMGILGPLTCLRADGEEFPAEITISQTEMVGKKIYTAILRDITTRVQTGKALRDSERRFRTLIEQSPFGIQIFDPDGTLRQVNRTWEELWQARGEDAIGQFNPLEDPQIREAGLLPLIERSFAGEAVALPDTRFDPGESGMPGRERWIRTHGYPVKDQNGRVLHVVVVNQDITDYKHAEQALRENEQRFRSIFEQSPIGIGVIDTLNHSFIQVNPKYCEIVGRTRDEMMNINFDMITHPDDIGKDKEELHRLTDGEIRTYNFDKRYIRPDQSVIWAHLTIVAMWEKQDDPKIHLTMVEDITERKRAEQEVANLSRFPTENPNPVLRIQNDGQVIYTNKASQELLEMWGCELNGYLPIDFKDLISELVESGVNKSVDIPCNDKVYAISLVPVTSSGYVNLYGSDITERKRIEEALQESEQRFSVLSAAAFEGIVISDRGQIIDVNEQLAAMLRCERLEMVGLPVEKFVAPESLELVLQHIRSGSEEPYEHLALRKDGSTFPVEIRAKSLPYSSRIVRVTAIRDITERKRAEEELRRRIDELSALYQTTLDIISVQDLPDLLNTIVMRAVDLLDGTGGGLYLCDAEQKKARCVVSYNTPIDYTGTVLAYGEGAAGTVAVTGKPLIIDDYQSWEGRAEAFESAHPFSAVISVPMLWYGGVTGVIHVLHDTQKHKFTEEDLKLLISFANQAAVVVENARLFEETQRRLDRLSALRRIDQVITSSLDLRVTLNILLGQIPQLLEVDAAAVLLYQPELHSLEFVAGQGFRTQMLQSTNLPLGRGFAGQAAKERRTIQVFDLEKLRTGFSHSSELRDEEFVAYIGVPLIAKGNIIGVLEIYNRQQLGPDEEWMGFLETLAGQAAIAIDNINLFNNLERSNLGLIQAYDATIEGWARALELRDMETEGHSRRVVDTTIELARQLGIEESQLVHVRQGALLHDIGKMGVPDSILQKTDSLTDEEWEIIYQHPVYANKWLTPISYLKPALDIPYCHHERWDGSGYPRGLEGEQIPLAARIFAVVDVWDALRSDRPYRKKWSKKKTRAYILEHSGKQFDPDVVEAFLALIDNEEKG